MAIYDLEKFFFSFTQIIDAVGGFITKGKR